MTTLITMGTYQGTAILYDPETEMVNLNLMWIATGQPKNKEPKFWLRNQDTQATLDAIAREQKVSVNHLLERKRGKGGGTWAHRRIALAYGAYLNPDLHALILKWAEERMDEEANPDLAYQRGRERAITGYQRRGWSDERIAQRLQGMDTRKAFTNKLQHHGVEGAGYGQCTDAIYEGVLGAPAKELRQERNLPVQANVRDSLDTEELATISVAEMVAGKRLDKSNAQGNRQCRTVCQKAGSDVRAALQKLLDV